MMKGYGDIDIANDISFYFIDLNNWSKQSFTNLESIISISFLA